MPFAFTHQVTIDSNTTDHRAQRELYFESEADARTHYERISKADCLSRYGDVGAHGWCVSLGEVTDEGVTSLDARTIESES